jgi:hypothetical protein
LREELDRKTFDTIEWLTDQVRAGNLTECQYSTGIDAVWSVANGLVGDSILEIVTAATELTKKKGMEKRVFTRNGAVSVLTWHVGDEFFTTATVNALSNKARRIEGGTAAMALQTLNTLAEKLLAAGWEEI